MVSVGPPDGDGWLHEVKHDERCLVAITAGYRLRLLSRNGCDRTALFREPCSGIWLMPGVPAMVLDDEIAVQGERGVIHIDALNEAIAERRPERFAYFAFDVPHLDGPDLRRCPLGDR